MNERFENLMYHAGLTASGCWDKMDDYDHDAIKKFAKLIVRECADFVAAGEFGDPGTAKMLMEDFGVEE
jgi:hypothetical protein